MKEIFQVDGNDTRFDNCWFCDTDISYGTLYFDVSVNVAVKLSSKLATMAEVGGIKTYVSYMCGIKWHIDKRRYNRKHVS